jgi:hypothetical protein
MRAHRRLPVFAAAALVLGAGACASGGGVLHRDTLLTEAPPPQDRVCRVAARPQELPAAAALVDEAALRADVARLWRGVGRPDGYVLLTLRYDREGMNVRRAVIEHSVPPALADTVQKLVFAHRRRTAEAGEEWGVRLRVDLGEAPRLRVGRREVCRPTPREPGYRTVSTGFDVRETSASSVNAPSLADLSLVWVRVRLDARGYVTDARVERSFTRGPWEVRVLNYVRSIPFLPALEDGFPVPAETSIPVRLAAIQ